MCLYESVLIDWILSAFRHVLGGLKWWELKSFMSLDQIPTPNVFYCHYIPAANPVPNEFCFESGYSRKQADQTSNAQLMALLLALLLAPT